MCIRDSLYDKICGGQYALSSPTPNSGGTCPLCAPPPWSTPMSVRLASWPSGRPTNMPPDQSSIFHIASSVMVVLTASRIIFLVSISLAALCSVNQFQSASSPVYHNFCLPPYHYHYWRAQLTYTSRLQNLCLLLSSAVASRLISLGAAFRDTLTVVVPEKWLCHSGYVNRFCYLLTYLLMPVLVRVVTWKLRLLVPTKQLQE